MRILILSQHYAPEVTAARVRLEAFAEGLVERGHEVEVICAVPNHPEGVVRPGYERKAIVRRRRRNLAVRYVWVRTAPRKTFASRMLLYWSYAGMAALAGCALRAPDVVFASSPPLPVGVAAAAISARHRVPWVFDVRDPWPEAALVLGELREGPVAELARRLERRLYRSATAIVTVTEPFRDDISSLVTEPGKVDVIMNGTTDAWLEAGDRDPEREALGLPPDRFIWAYAGNLGLAQGLEATVDAAARLGEDTQLLLLGDGPMREALERRASSLPAGRVSFRGLVQPAEAARYMRAADALLVPLADHPALRKFVPSKLFDCCAVGRPVIVAAAGESQRLIADAGAGLAVAPGDATALANAVSRLQQDPELAGLLGEAGRRFAAHHLREPRVAHLERVLADTVARGRGE